MKFMKVLIACAAMFIVHTASAQITLSLTPVTTGSVAIGESVEYALTLSGLQGYDNLTEYGMVVYSQNGPGLSGFNIAINYDPSAVSLSLSSFLTSFGPGVDEGIYTNADSSVAGQLWLEGLSFDFDPSHFIGLDANGLPVNQPSTLTLATITVTGVSAGSATLAFDLDLTTLSDQEGNALAAGVINDEVIEVVPEPSEYALMGAALAMAAMIKFRRRFAHAA